MNKLSKGEMFVKAYKWSDKYGLLNPDKNLRSENGILFTMEFYLLMHELYGFDGFNYKAFNELQLDLYVEDGLYSQTPFGMLDENGELEPVSHDNLTAIAASAYMYNRGDDINSEIWSYLKRHLFTYDFRVPGVVNFDRIMHIRDVIFYGFLAGSIICMLLMPIVVLANVISCLRANEHTSGKLLVFVRNRSSRKRSLLMRVSDYICDFIIEWKYDRGWRDVFAIYFKEGEHPCNLLAEEIW